MTTPKAIIIGAAILAVAILVSMRFDGIGAGSSYIVIHDRWAGTVTHCSFTTSPPGGPSTKEYRWYCGASPIAGPVPALWRW